MPGFGVEEARLRRAVLRGMSSASNAVTRGWPVGGRYAALAPLAWSWAADAMQRSSVPARATHGTPAQHATAPSAPWLPNRPNGRARRSTMNKRS